MGLAPLRCGGGAFEMWGWRAVEMWGGTVEMWGGAVCAASAGSIGRRMSGSDNRLVRLKTIGW